MQKIVDQILLHLRNREDRGRFQLEELRQDLYEHLKSYLSMSAQERMEDENEYVLGEIRDYYSFYYQLAWECAEAVKAEMGKDFSTMEICYLAVYLYKNSIHTEEERKNVIIVCATGKGLSHFLTLLEYTAKLPPEVQLSQDAMLGMIIHMSMAVPRWFVAEKREEENEEYRREYYRVKEQYPDVFYIMEKFFELVKKTFQVKISISERTAFFLYIIEEV